MSTAQRRRLHPGWWTALLIAFLVGFVVLCSASFAGTLESYIPVTITSDRAGLVMESGAKVKLRGVQVGRVAGVKGGLGPVQLNVQLFPAQAKLIPANAQARIRANTIFGAKYVDLVYPQSPSPQRISAGAVISSLNVSTEVDTVFQSLVDVLHRIDPPKLNGVLTAVADAVRGRGERIGDATTAANHVLLAINPRMPVLQRDWRAVAEASDAYGGAAGQLLDVLDAASTTSTTVSTHADELNALLLNVIGFAQAGTDLLGPSAPDLVHAINALRPTTDLLLKYSPEYTCTLTGAKWWLDHGGYQTLGGDGRTVVLDDALLLGDDPYRYPDNLPVVAAKGGPGGKPSCGSLPDVSANFPVRQLVTNTGWGTGLDIRPNPGIGFPGWIDYLPVTRAVPQPPSIRSLGPPAPGPPVGLGAPPYGAAQYGPDGTPLYPSVPDAPMPSFVPPTPADSAPTP